MMTQAAPVVDVDDNDPKPASAAGGSGKPAGQVPAPSRLAAMRARLTSLQARYTDQYPEIRKLKLEIADEEAKAGPTQYTAPVEMVAAVPSEPAAPAPQVASPRRAIVPTFQYQNPVLQAQLKTVEDEIAKHKQEQQRLTKLASGYQAKLEAIPVREQEVADLVRDYEISKAHYQQLLNNQLSAETATQLEIRQKGEKFSVLDPAQPAEKPSSPNRMLINSAGAIVGLALGLLVGIATELLGMSITAPEQVAEVTGMPLLEVIPVILTHVDQRTRRKRLVLATVSGVIATILASGAALFYHYRS
jgi:hypothetical protein